MQTYKDLIDTIVRCLIKEGFTFIEAYEEVLSVGRLDPRTTIHHLAHNNPSSDRESLLEFKAYNASCRLQRKYAMVLKKYAPLLACIIHEES
jgi:hypothetical protein